MTRPTGNLTTATVPTPHSADVAQGAGAPPRVPLSEWVAFVARVLGYLSGVAFGGIFLFVSCAQLLIRSDPSAPILQPFLYGVLGAPIVLVSLVFLSRETWPTANDE
jgi:hypothetical protein